CLPCHKQSKRQTPKKQYMSKIIAAINMTLDGFCDHTAIIPDEEIHQHYADLLRNANSVLYGRTTYQLMEFWRTLVTNPSGDKTMDEFAVVMDNTPKIVFSRTLKNVDWKSAKLAIQDLEEEVLELKKQPGKDNFVGSPGLIVALTNLGLIDEYQLCVHPVIVGNGLPLFKNINDRSVLKLVRTKTFRGGAVILYYESAKRG
ncbi:MAG TPA: dihydrofolate reductase family protein, partial [Cyclobacteriaceae bacterium]|nr:dihydrofolate reductase family protein [Cyclobacteriaceae bacterium]